MRIFYVMWGYVRLVSKIGHHLKNQLIPVRIKIIFVIFLAIKNIIIKRSSYNNTG